MYIFKSSCLCQDFGILFCNLSPFTSLSVKVVKINLLNLASCGKNGAYVIQAFYIKELKTEIHSQPGLQDLISPASQGRPNVDLLEKQKTSQEKIYQY